MVDFVFVLTALAVLWSTNPVIAIISLISLFIVTAILLFVQGVHFLALVLLIVYIGAIAVLFLFIAMMLEVGNEFNRFTYAEEMSDVDDYLIEIAPIIFISIIFYMPIVKITAINNYIILSKFPNIIHQFNYTDVNLYDKVIEVWYLSNYVDWNLLYHYNNLKTQLIGVGIITYTEQVNALIACGILLTVAMFATVDIALDRINQFQTKYQVISNQIAHSVSNLTNV